MTYNCGAIFVKYFLCLLNFIFFLCGGLVLAIGLWLIVDNTSFLVVTKISETENLEVVSQSSVIDYGAYLLIIVGLLTLLMGFIGCCGAAMESRALLITYGLLIIVIFCLEIAAGVLAATYYNQAQLQVENYMKYTLHEYYSGESTANAVTVFWNALMIKLHCCGVNNFTDFEKAANWRQNKSYEEVIPAACCVLGSRDFADDNSERCLTDPDENNSYYLTGCLPQVYTRMFYFILPMLSSAIFLGTLQLLLITLSFYLCRAVWRYRKVVMDD